jgi:hypothetical protein
VFLPLLGEHVLQALEDHDHGVAFKLPKPFHETVHINRPKLIERNEAYATLKMAARTPWVRASAGCHRRYDDGTEMFIQFVRRYDHARPRLPDLTAQRGVEANEMNLAAADRWADYRHSHSSRSNLVDGDSSRSRSSRRALMRLAAAAHPVRGWRAAWTTNRPGCAWSSTSSGRAASSSSVFGIRIPRELPILTMRVFVAIVITV